MDTLATDITVVEGMSKQAKITYLYMLTLSTYVAGVFILASLCGVRLAKVFNLR